MFFHTLCRRRLCFLDRLNLYREKPLCSDICKNMPAPLVRGHHFLKDMIYCKLRMDDIIERPLVLWLKKVAQDSLYIWHYWCNRSLWGLCFKVVKSFVHRPVHPPEANDRKWKEAHLCSMKKYQFNFLQPSGRNFPQTVQQIKTEQTFMNKDVFIPVSLATVFFTTAMSTTVAMTKGWVWPWAG